MTLGSRISILLIFAAIGILIMGAYYLAGIALKNSFIDIGEHFKAFFKQAISFFRGMV